MQFPGLPICELRDPFGISAVKSFVLKHQPRLLTAKAAKNGRERTAAKDAKKTF
jgi:hypothetical protein